MVFVSFDFDPSPIVAAAADKGVLIPASNRQARLVTHMDLTDDTVDQVVEIFKEAIPAS